MVSATVSALYRDLATEFSRETGMVTDEMIVSLLHAMLDDDYEYAPAGLYTAIRDEQCRLFLLTCITRAMHQTLLEFRAQLRTTADRFTAYRPPVDPSEEEMADEATMLADATLDLIAITSRVDLVAQVRRTVDRAVRDILYAPPGHPIDYTVDDIDLCATRIGDDILVSKKTMQAVKRLQRRSTNLQTVSRGLTRFAKHGDEQILDLLRWIRQVETGVDQQFKRPVAILYNRLTGFDLTKNLPSLQQAFDQIFFIDDRVRSLVILFRDLNDMLPYNETDQEADPLLVITVSLRGTDDPGAAG